MEDRELRVEDRVICLAFNLLFSIVNPQSSILDLYADNWF